LARRRALREQLQPGTLHSGPRSQSSPDPAKVLRGIDASIPETTVYPGQIAGQETVAAFAERWLPRHDVRTAANPEEWAHTRASATARAWLTARIEAGESAPRCSPSSSLASCSMQSALA
jgi:hypothetical protein